MLSYMEKFENSAEMDHWKITSNEFAAVFLTELQWSTEKMFLLQSKSLIYVKLGFLSKQVLPRTFILKDKNKQTKKNQNIVH